MAIKLHILEADPRMKPLKAAVKAVATRAIRLFEKQVKTGNVDVVVYINPEAAIPEIGIGGYTPVENSVLISLDPDHKQLKKNLATELAYTLIHEVHHAIRFRKHIDKETLLEAMVSEGLADNFAMRVTGRRQPPAWCTALNAAEKGTYLKKAGRVWNDLAYNHGLWFFGADPKKVKRWAAYTLAYDLVEAHLKKHPEFEITRDFAADAKQFAGK